MAKRGRLMLIELFGMLVMAFGGFIFFTLFNEDSLLGTIKTLVSGYVFLAVGSALILYPAHFLGRGSE